jgi:hypothetical protein
MLIAQYLPAFDVRDSHELRVAAPADTAYAALCSLDLQRSWVVQALFPAAACRAVASGAISAPALGDIPRAGAGRRLGRARRGAGARVGGRCGDAAVEVCRHVPGPPAEFLRFSAPGFTKIVWAMAARPVTPGVSVLSIETQVLATDPASRRKFRLYWCVVSSGVRLLRWAALYRAKRELERVRQPS